MGLFWACKPHTQLDPIRWGVCTRCGSMKYIAETTGKTRILADQKASDGSLALDFTAGGTDRHESYHSFLDINLAHASPTGKSNAPERLAYCTIASRNSGVQP